MKPDRSIFILLCFFALWFSPIAVNAQDYAISGIARDSVERIPLIGVNVLLFVKGDSTHRTGVATDLDGKFQFGNVQSGNYTIKISYLGYKSRQVNVTVREVPINLGDIILSPSSTMLKAVEVKATSVAVEQKGDTIQYNASAFKVGREASAEDLLSKMPGMTSDNTGVKVQGETVQKVLVDGKEFFGDDAALALKNIPAEIIEKMEVFDRMSEQSQLTGFDDGQSQKTINIVTRKGKNEGKFGRVYAGVGDDGHYAVGGNLNSFKGVRKLSVVGQSNNVNQQNFTSEDLAGVISSSGGGSRGGGGRGGRGGGSGGNNFTTGQQPGISTTHAVGLNYVDEWSKKTKVSGSYFFNKSINKRISDLNRLYITPTDSGLTYQELNRVDATSNNHRANLRLEHQIDSVNTVILTARLGAQQGDGNTLVAGDYLGPQNGFERTLRNGSTSDNNSFSLVGSVLFRHRFAKRGRSLSVGMSADVNDQSGSGTQDAIDQTSDSTIVIDQRSRSVSDSYVLSTNVDYTEPLGKHGQVQLSYSPSFRDGNSDKRTFSTDSESQQEEIDPDLSNVFDNKYINHRGGVGYRYNFKKVSFNTTANVQYATLKSTQSFPGEGSISRRFSNFLPQLSLNYKFSKTRNLRLTYRSSANAPSVSQLQNVVDNRNPLFLRSGNPALGQDYNQNISLRYGNADIEKSTNLLMYLNFNTINDYITNTSVIATNDTTVNGVFLSKGTQLSFPVNIAGYQSLRGMLTYGFPVKPLKSNMNMSTSANYNRVPSLINGLRNLANNYTIGQSVVLSSNISERIDFNVSSNANYTIIKNSIQEQSDNNYWNFVTSIRVNWLFWKGFIFTSNVNNTINRGLSADMDQNIWYWNAGLGYKFLKDEALEIKMNVFDILDQNASIRRDINENYIEDVQINVLQRYFLLTVSYRISQFK